MKKLKGLFWHYLASILGTIIGFIGGCIYRLLCYVDTVCIQIDYNSDSFKDYLTGGWYK